MCTQHLTSGHSNLLRINCRVAPRSLVHYMWLSLMHVAWRCARAGGRGGARRCETLTFDMCVLERARWESCLSPRRGPDQPPAGRARQPLPRRPRAPAAAGGLREAMRVPNGRWALGANSSMTVKTCLSCTLLTSGKTGQFTHPFMISRSLTDLSHAAVGLRIELWLRHDACAVLVQLRGPAAIPMPVQRPRPPPPPRLSGFQWGHHRHPPPRPR